MLLNYKYIIYDYSPQNSSESAGDSRVEANIQARRDRHRRVFTQAAILSRSGLASAAAVFKNPANILGIKNALEKRKRANAISPTNRLFRSYAIAVGTLFVIGSISPGYAREGFYSTEGLTGMDAYYNDNIKLIADSEGFITKTNPQTETSNRSEIAGKLIHEVESGETLSTIANGYGLKTSTLLWENGLNSSSTIRVGQKLIIPSVDGVSHIVAKNQDIKKIAGLYSIKEDDILKINHLDSTATIKAGQSIFIPGGKPLPGAIDRYTPTRIGSSTRVDKNAVIYSTEVTPGAIIGSDNYSVPGEGKIMIFPTKGKITQGFKRGHYAYDIADSSKPPIWAAMTGKVVKVSTGTWGGGYGNHIIIDHGNGLQTLYAHMETVAVNVGDEVTQGQVVGKMGRTGNVRGKTGIHLHFEVHKNGVKLPPADFF